MKPPKNGRIGLIFLFTATVFVTLLVTIVIFGSIIVFLVETGRLETMGRSVPIVFSAVTALALGTLFSNVLVRVPLGPIKRLIAGMRRLSEGHFEERLDMENSILGAVPIFRELSESFNMMAGELQSTEMLRSDFVNNFSHEFKTPIVSIRGFAKLLQRGDLTQEERQEYIGIIVDESTRLSNMATNVLNLTKIENQSILTEVTEFNLSEQIRKCILMLEKKWEKKRLRISAEFAEYEISGNMGLMNQVWINLMDNAVKFSPEEGEIRVSIEEAGEEVKVSILNHGPEITEEQKKRLYDKFWQGDASRAAEGTGIGLSIVKKAVELHRGRIEVRSDPEETVFSVYLPR